ncbi:hypothetical protein [Desulfuromonas thiophila]|uniref:GIY-YIG nuclease family protein n=1 Tax=Desulfuromonas thiophila TaxID=57664 RepID=A0A1G6XK44_9BACT|nr:hypothetical protein SAMN05661003_101274 [Desulfuromonas thiophila]
MVDFIEAYWAGPYAWPGFETDVGLSAIPKHPGIYLLTAEYRDGYIIYAAGITRRPFPTRFREHTRKYLAGDYTILEMSAMSSGIRKEIWHGWGWTPEKRRDYEERRSDLVVSARRQLAAFRVFVADVGTVPRLLERLEAAIMNTLYKEMPPYCEIPDRGMMLAPRWETEKVITVRFQSHVKFFGLPVEIEI